MDAHEKQQLLDSLEGGRAALIAALDGVTEDQARCVPEPGRWSVLECVEHLFLVENNLLERVMASQPSETPVGSRAREERILQRGADRTNRFEAPEQARPTGRFPTLAQALAAFLDKREQTIAYVRAASDDLRLRATTHPLIGAVNSYENLLIMSIHPHRHSHQIKEIRTALATAR